MKIKLHKIIRISPSAVYLKRTIYMGKYLLLNKYEIIKYFLIHQTLKEVLVPLRLAFRMFPKRQQEEEELCLEGGVAAVEGAGRSGSTHSDAPPPDTFTTGSLVTGVLVSVNRL